MSKITTFLLALLFSITLSAQSTCDNLVPSIIIDLSNNPNQQYISPNLFRDGLCCTTSTNCVEFVITLHPDAVGVIFDIYSGAVPPGALYYQIDCGPQTFVGESLCLNDVGPHYLTFCKPGGNSNEFMITSLSKPNVSDEITINEGCNGQLEAFDYEESTITWNSISPGAPGAYNGYLDCTSACANVNVSASGNFPTYVDYQVCGSPTGGCNNTVICDTVRVYFNSTLGVSITANPQIICYGQNSSILTANPTGGTQPYTYLWNTGETTQSITVTNGASYSITLSDGSGCPGISATINVTKITAQPIVDAGVTQNVCSDFFPIQLSATYLNLDNIEWSGGTGTFSSSNIANATYTPTQAEIDNGSVTLNIEGIHNNGCPSVFDDVIINLFQYEASVVVSPKDISCFGFDDGEALLNVSGPNGPYTNVWSNGNSNQNSISGLTNTQHIVTVTNNYGCSSTYNFTINEPTALTITTIDVKDISCNGLTDGTIEIEANGGTGIYDYEINSNPTLNVTSNLSAGNYAYTVIDENGCVAKIDNQVNEPAPLDMALNVNDVKCYNQANGRVEVQVTGGVGQYSCQNMIYNASGFGMIDNLIAGNYNLFAEDENGCNITKSATVNQPQQLSSQINNADTVCPGLPIILSANPTGGNSPYTYSWSNSSTQAQSISIVAQQYSQFSVEVTDQNGCKSQAYSEYYVPTLNPDDLTLETDNEICLGDEIIINANYFGDNQPTNIAWNTDFDGFGSFTDTPTQNKGYTITIEDKCANFISKSVDVLVRSLPQINLPSLVAEGCPPLVVDFSAYAQNPNIAQFNWEFGNGAVSNENSPIVTFYEEGDINISLEVVDVYGCANDVTGESNISVYPAPNASPRAPNVVVDEYNPTIQFYNESIGYTDFTWSFDDNTYSKEDHPVHEFREIGTFEVELYVENDLGCIDKKSVTVEVKPVANVFIPNAFSPNGDGLNDEFSVEGYNLVDDDYELNIYNRWGELIFKSESRSDGWDGIHQNSIVPQGNYVYKVRVRDVLGNDQELTGSVAVVR